MNDPVAVAENFEMDVTARTATSLELLLKLVERHTPYNKVTYFAEVDGKLVLFGSKPPKTPSVEINRLPGALWGSALAAMVTAWLDEIDESEYPNRYVDDSGCRGFRAQTGGMVFDTPPDKNKQVVELYALEEYVVLAITPEWIITASK